VLGLAAEFGADIATGSFETIGSTQVARLALTVDPAHAQRIARSFAAAGVNAEVRA
jgi:D-methionine ABC transporter, ATP-binding protein